MPGNINLTIVAALICVDYVDGVAHVKFTNFGSRDDLRPTDDVLVVTNVQNHHHAVHELHRNLDSHLFGNTMKPAQE